MGNPVQALRALQEIDRDLFRVNAELERLPEERARRQARLDRANELLDEKRTSVLDRKVKIKELEDTVSVQQARIRKLDKESQSNRDVTVVEACRYEMRGLKRQIDEAEREELVHMETIDRVDAEASDIAARIDKEQLVFKEFCQNVESEMGVAQGKREELTVQRAGRLDSELDLATLDLYERLLAARGGEALAMLDGGVCQSCFMQVPPNLVVRLTRGNQVIQCSSCDRIMYLP
jgi:predicted  nucleic acid-binding Zn-ribbon protein